MNRRHVPQSSPAAFKDSLHNHPRQAAAAALTGAARHASGDPSRWKTFRALKLPPGALRVRVAGDYRLLFEIGPAETLRLVDLILRRDLDRWLTAAEEYAPSIYLKEMPVCLRLCPRRYHSKLSQFMESRCGKLRRIS